MRAASAPCACGLSYVTNDGLCLPFENPPQFCNFNDTNGNAIYCNTFDCQKPDHAQCGVGEWNRANGYHECQANHCTCGHCKGCANGTICDGNYNCIKACPNGNECTDSSTYCGTNASNEKGCFSKKSTNTLCAENGECESNNCWTSMGANAMCLPNIGEGIAGLQGTLDENTACTSHCDADHCNNDDQCVTGSYCHWWVGDGFRRYCRPN